jgi:hypothetical protein
MIWEPQNKNYIFLTTEGFTFQPESNCIEPDIENVQVIGFASGYDAQDAFDRLLQRNPYLHETRFNEIFSMQLAESKKKTYFSLKNNGR